MNISYMGISLHFLECKPHILCTTTHKVRSVKELLWPCHADAKGAIRELVLPRGLDLERPKRTRTSFTAEQLYRLECEFQRCQYLVGRERTELARQLNLSETQVRAQVSTNDYSACDSQVWMSWHFISSVITLITLTSSIMQTKCHVTNDVMWCDMTVLCSIGKMSHWRQQTFVWDGAC